MIRVAILSVAFAFGALAFGAVHAAPAAPAAAAKKPALLPDHNNNAPINISADKFLADSNAKTGTWSGNVVVNQGDIKMRANTVRLNVVGKGNNPDKIFANGNVVVVSPTSGTATGDAAVYEVNPKLVTLSGHVVLKRAKDVMTGSTLTVNLVTGQATLGAHPVAGAPVTQGGRVTGVFTPSGATQ
jgi:lipopolysaccharide export system protein LptA